VHLLPAVIAGATRRLSRPARIPGHFPFPKQSRIIRHPAARSPLPSFPGDPMLRPLLPSLSAAALLLAACASVPRAAQGDGRTLRPFRDDAELAEFHRDLQRQRLEIWRREEERRQREETPVRPMHGPVYPYPYPSYSAPHPPGLPVQHGRFVLTDQDAPWHHEGGDERAAVQLRGDRLVLLRRGRLFTARLGEDAPRPLSAVDALGKVRGTGSGYEEVLVASDPAVVIGVGSAESELVLFRLSPDGEPAHRATYAVRSGASVAEPHTYAARVVDGRVVFYAPLPVDPAQPTTHLPRLHRWGTPGEATAPASRVYRPAEADPPPLGLVLHTVMSCEPGDAGLRCESTAVYAWQARVFHMSSTAVYAWVPGIGDRPAVLYRIPLDGTAPAALQVPNEPVDPSAFLERDGHLHVLAYPAGRVRPVSLGMTTGPLVLLRVPLAEFGDGRRGAAPDPYRELPLHGWGALRHRFVDGWLVYGTNAGPAASRRGYASAVYAVPLAGGELSRVMLPHGVDRIEPMGSGVAVLGTDETRLHVAGLRLGPGGAALAQAMSMPGDTAYGFFYRADGPDAGLAAIPFRRPGLSGMAAALLGADGIRFLRNRDFHLEEAGELAGEFSGDDGCLTSCFHWYGDTRPLFVDGRILALLGDELVEGREVDGRVREVRRVKVAQPPPVADVAGEWTFSETLDGEGGRYACRARGTLRLAGTPPSVRVARTDDCTLDGAAATRTGEASGSAEVRGSGVMLDVEGCVYEGRVRGADEIYGMVFCRLPLREGATAPLTGTWEARRARP
jgi:hypothetical protein